MKSKASSYLEILVQSMSNYAVVVFFLKLILEDIVVWCFHDVMEH